MTSHRPVRRERSTPSRGAADPGAAVLREAPLDDLARHAVMVVLCRQSKLWPDTDLTVLDRTLELLGDRLSAVDRSFVHALYDAVVRRWTTLEYLVQRELRQPLAGVEPRLRAVLLAGAAQVVFLDRVPAHAAINHAVEWGKRIIRPGAGGMVNAALRRLSEHMPPDRASTRRERFTGASDELALDDGGALPLIGAALPDDPVLRLSIASSCPTALLDHWLQSRPMAQVRALALHGLARPPVVLNTAHARAALGAELAPHGVPGHHVWCGAPGQLETLLRSRDDLWVQDAGSSGAIESVRGMSPSPRVIADLCAGQGTKTRQLAALFPEAEVVASDLDVHRLRTLGQVFAGNPRVRVKPLREARAELVGRCDLIVLDVPCSNTGVLSRRPEAKYRFDASHLQSLTGVQRQIIADAIPLLRESPRGSILYSTCSIEPEENQHHASWTCTWHHLRESRERADLPTGGPGEAPSAYQDGSFSVLLGA